MTDAKKSNRGDLKEGSSCCSIAAIVPIDGRGQIVLPKELREKAEIGPGDRLALVAHEAGGRICCFSLFKSDDLSGMIKDKLGPLLRDLND